MTYKRLGEYAAIGDGNTVVLVGRDGSIDWCPLPHVESPSVFAALLDSDRGGYFSVRPKQSFESVQRYYDRTNVLETTFSTAGGSATVTDFMSVPEASSFDEPPSTIYRKLSCEDGPVGISIEFEPRFDYARAIPEIESNGDSIVAIGDDERIALSSGLSLRRTADGHGASAKITLRSGETYWLVLSYSEAIPHEPSHHQKALKNVVKYWQEWAHDCDGTNCPVAGPWHDLVVRSSLVLKLLIHRETGAVCAAPTTSLPEDIGGVRNWDYRFNWIRDAAFTVRALSELNHLAEARSYFQLCLDHCRDHDPAEIPPLYGLHGESIPDERVLDHLEGYRGSAPVRVGNAARTQHQLDVYGELVLAVYESARYGEPITHDNWGVIRKLVNYVCEGWDEPDASIWEPRDDARQYVYSKVMCWVALDRGIKLADTADNADAPLDRWQTHRENVRESILKRGYSERTNSFVQALDDDETLDAANLLLPAVGFLSPEDPRVQGTIDATINRLTTDDGLVRRYKDDDGLPGEASPFIVCSFWLVTALALAGRTDEAIERFESVLKYASPLGLLAEAVDPETGEQRGNFPQAYSHIGLINSALYLGKAIDSNGESPGPLGSNDSLKDDDLGEKIVRESDDNEGSDIQ